MKTDVVLNTLTLQLAHRDEEILPSGGRRTGRNYLDYFISGTSLSELLNASNHDLIGSLGWGLNQEAEWQDIDLFLGKEVSTSVVNRVSLFVCPECGELGCGAITVRVAWQNNLMVWSDFGFENGIDEPDMSEFKHIGPFYFEKRQYEAVFESIRPRL